MYLLALLTAVLASSLTLARAQELSTFTSQLGNSQALQGQQQKLSPFTLTILTNETHALVAVNISQPPDAVGYAAVGFGTQMSNADMLVFWPNNDLTWTASHRTAGGHTMPQPVESQPSSSDLSIVSALTTNTTSSPYASFAFLRPLSLSAAYAGKPATLSRASGQNIVYAYSAHNPGSSAQSATIVMHDAGAFGAMQMDLSQPAGQALVAQAAVQPWTRRDSIIVLHALCGCLAWLIVAPIAVLIGRLGRSYDGWLRLHQMLQTLLTVSLTIAAVALGGVAVNETGGQHGADGHKVLGFIILALLLLQAGLGMYIHRLFSANRTKRPLRNVVHILLGVTLICLGYAQVFRGFGEYERSTPGYVVAIAVISLAGFFLAWVFSGLRLVQSRREQGLSWRQAAFGLGRDSPVHLDEKHALDAFAQPPPVQSTPRLADLTITTHDRAQPYGALPISDQFTSRGRAQWQAFDQSETDLPWQSRVEQHPYAMEQYSQVAR